jgi:hypothetical protein
MLFLENSYPFYETKNTFRLQFFGTKADSQNVYCGTIRASLHIPEQLSENKPFAIFFPLHHNTSEILSWSRRQF